MVQFVRHSDIPCSLTFSLVISLAFPERNIKLGMHAEKPRPTFYILSLQALSRGNTLFLKPDCTLSIDTTRSANGPTHGKVIFRLLFSPVL